MRSNRDWGQYATNNPSQVSASYIVAFGTLWLSLEGSRMPHHCGVRSHPRIAARTPSALILASGVMQHDAVALTKSLGTTIGNSDSPMMIQKFGQGQTGKALVKVLAVRRSAGQGALHCPVWELRNFHPSLVLAAKYVSRRALLPHFDPVRMTVAALRVPARVV